MFSSDKKDLTDFNYEGEDLEAMSLARNYYAWIADIIKPYLGKHVVEGGAGVGSFSHLLRDLGQPRHLTLVEPSKKTHNILNKRIKSTGRTVVKTINGYLKGNEPRLRKNNVDTFVYINVFEHIEDDNKEMQRIANTLQKGGHAVIFVPALDRLYSEFDRSIGHYRRYNKKRLRELANSANMAVVSIRYIDLVGILPWWLNMVLVKNKKLSPKAVRIYDTLAIPIIRAIETTVKPPIGKNILLVARKN